jgi:hypothetical protein
MAAIAYPTPIDSPRPTLRLVVAPRATRPVPAVVYRRRRLIAVLIIALVLAAATVVAARIGASGAPQTSPPPAPGVVYVVQPGDTLWSIAAKLAPGADPRDEVDRLAAINGGAALRVGQRLQLTQG